MNRFDKIPVDVSGLFWDYANGQDEPEPVLLDEKKHPGAMKGFNGRLQAWMRDGEYLIGPQSPPSRTAE